MCYDDAATPPPGRSALTTANPTTPTLTSADGTEFAAFGAFPADSAARTGVGVLVLPDNRGLRPFYDRLASNLAEQGHIALAIDYYGRTDGVNRDRPADTNLWPLLGGLTRAGLYADWACAIDWLRAADCHTVLSLGFCLGGRFAFQTAAPEFGLAGVIGCYGALGPINGAPGPIQLASQLRAPVLGLFGGADAGIPAEQIEEFGRALDAAGVPHELVSYPGAPHGFFDTNEAADHAAACADVWQRILDRLASTAN